MSAVSASVVLSKSMGTGAATGSMSAAAIWVSPVPFRDLGVVSPGSGTEDTQIRFCDESRPVSVVGAARPVGERTPHCFKGTNRRHDRGLKPVATAYRRRLTRRDRAGDSHHGVDAAFQILVGDALRLRLADEVAHRHHRQ